MYEVTGDRVLLVNIMARTDIYVCVQILILMFILANSKGYSKLIILGVG